MKIKKSVTQFLFVGIILLAAILRLWNLSNNPPHLTPDEASLGYNAYSILKTGKDEYGEGMPIIFKSFGDYKPGLYVYTAVPFVALFGLNEWSVRLPSAIAGIVAIWLIYLVIKQLQINLKLETGNWKLEIAAALMLALSPWHVQFSRGAWEVNVALTLTLAGVYFFLKSFSKSFYITLSSLFFGLTFLTYHGAKLSTPIILLVLSVVFYRDIVLFIKQSSKYALLSIVTFLVFLVPMGLSFIHGQANRLQVLGISNSPGSYSEPFESLFHSETLQYGSEVLFRFFNHFSGNFLFFEGDWVNPRHSPPYSGVLTHFDFVFLIFGIIALVQLKSRTFKMFIILWLLLAPLPSILSKDPVHAIRSYHMLIPLTIILALGCLRLIQIILLSQKKFVYCSFVIGFYSVSYLYFLDAYFMHQPKHNAKLWDYGYKQIVETVIPIQNNYRQITVQQSFAQPYIYFLFFQKYDPETYQKHAQLTSTEYINDVGRVERIDNICFCPIDWSINRGDHNTLVIGDPIRIPPVDSSNSGESTLIKSVLYPNGVEAFRIIDVK